MNLKKGMNKCIFHMVDAVGTNVYTDTAGNQLLTEDGPFASDTVTNTYVNRIRVGLALQQPVGFWTNGFGRRDFSRGRFCICGQGFLPPADDHSAEKGRVARHRPLRWRIHGPGSVSRADPDGEGMHG